MHIHLHSKYKSINPIEGALELPDLVILTGLNGSGKTQLLEGISEKKIHLIDGEKQLESIKYVSKSEIAQTLSASQLKTEISANIERIKEVNSKFKYRPQQEMLRLAKSNAGGLQAGDIQIIDQISKAAGKSRENLSNEDIDTYFPLNAIARGDMFSTKFQPIFKLYAERKLINEIKQLRNKGEQKVEFFSDKRFLEIFGDAPWDLLNNIITSANLDYYIKPPEIYSLKDSYEAKLINKLTGVEISFADLSSGEKVIMSLALSLYNANLSIEFPEVLLMDEPDSHLHPSMTNKFLDVVQNVFVNEKKMKVLLTTHSPSTVALAPEESLFIMEKFEPRIMNINKDKALRVLTEGVPTLSIHYENRRQVFVESRNDVVFYEKIYEKLKDELEPEISINFISSGIRKDGDCFQVQSIVDILTRFGNRSIFGIVDWDGGRNKETDFVKVPGMRYSIENYIFDPIFLILLLLKERFIEDQRELLDLKGERIEASFINFDNEKLQTLANFIVEKIKTKVADQSKADLQLIEYKCGKQIKVPTWFLEIKGHQLEEYIKQLFPQLNRYQKEGELKEKS